ncbi:MAG: type I secretion C-terminal target domain-containing protein, partial [Halioglobus sp.]|nr:type I secretion C-terminal target domain-containing protein [Halioglobus sp.]
ENYTVSASLAGGNTDMATGGITDSDVPSLSIDSVQANEGQPLTFTVTLSAASASAVSVNWATAFDTAGANPAGATDFTGASGTVEFAPGETTKTVTIETLQDSMNEPNETLLVQLDTPVGATIAAGTGTGTILDDDGPTAGTSSATVDEDGLPGGIGDSADGDWADTNADGDANEATFSGILPGTAGENGPATFDFAAMDAQVANIGAEQVTYAWNAGSNTLTATTSSGDRVGTDLFEVSLNPTSGAYSVTLLTNALHGVSGTEDDITAALTYTVRDAAGDAASGTLSITIDDDLPVVNGGDQAVADLNYNLTVMLDISGSMSSGTSISDGQGGTLTRFEAAVEAINRLFDAYEGLGDVRVRLVTFSSSAAALGSAWTTTADARVLLDGLTPGGLTNYRAALEVVSGIESMSSGSFGSGAWFDPGKLVDGINVAYFASDGNPNVEGSINGSREAAWEAFLEDNQILSYALGLGNGVNTAQLNPIAYDGQQGVEIDALPVTDFEQLSDTIVATVPPITGTLFSSPAAGADGMVSLEVTIDGVTYTYSYADDTLQVTGAGDYAFDEGDNLLTVTSAKNGVWMIDLDDGSFTYQADAMETGTDGLTFTLTDGDGDAIASSVDINLDGADALAEAQAVVQVEGSLDAPLLGTAGDDVFVWELADIGTPGNPDADTVLRFGSEGNDVLDLSDLLVDANPGEGGDIGDLDQFLNITSDGTDTVVRVSSSGGFAGGSFDPAAVDQTITLIGVDLGDDSAQAIRDLLSSGQLLTD